MDFSVPEQQQSRTQQETTRDMNLPIKKLRELVVKAGVFNASWYASTYPDSRHNGLKALEDFLTFGVLLNRDPGPELSIREYTRRVPEALKHPGGPLMHYLEKGSSSHPLPVLSKDPSKEDLLSSRLAQVPGLLRVSGRIDMELTLVRIQDFRLHVRGWILDPDRPGAVHRLRFRLGDIASSPVVARQIVNDRHSEQGPICSGLFESSLVVPEHLQNAVLEIDVLDSDTRYCTLPEQAPLQLSAKGSTAVVLPNDVIIGSVDVANSLTVSGWALCERDKASEGIELILKINGAPYTVTRCTLGRADVQRLQGGEGFAGFQFHLPANLWTGETLDYEISATQGASRIKRASGQIAPPAGIWNASSRAAPDTAWEHNSDLDAGRSVSVIILNRNGRDILEDMLLSAEATGDLARAEWIVLDHQSTDGSADLCESFRDRGFDIRVISRNGNFSFSESNNHGVSLARGDILVFANNDLVFTMPVMDRLLEGLRDSKIGILGAELLDHVSAPEWHEAGDRNVIQHRGVHIKTRSERGYLRPFEARASADQPVAPDAYYPRPAVTAAFIAMRRADFENVKGFDETYYYGLEDVDLSLKVTRDLGLASVLDTGLRIIHRHGFSRQKDTHAAPQRVRNNKHFNATWGTWLHSQIRKATMSRPAFWTGRRPVIGFAVLSETAGDYFTALELGTALQQQADVHVVYIPREGWGDLSNIDILINMSPNFDLHAIKQTNPFLITVNWIRQFFERWSESDSLASYDHVIASSQLSADFLSEYLGYGVPVMPIASNTAHFAAGISREQFRCDYCFTGSHFGVSREIQFCLDPSAIKGEGAVFGGGWEKTEFAKISRGLQPYEDMRDIYASTRIVIDDGVFATGPWGSVNSRVFDALAAGCLLVTNNRLGAAELFGGLLPTYHDRESLTEVLNWWLSHEDKRQERVRALRAIVNERHDYRQRASQVIDILLAEPPLRISIKCPAKRANKEQWGDYHFACSLAKSLRELGAVVRIDLLEDWDGPLAETDEVVIVLRGLSRYTPKLHQLNLMWLISHPEAVSIEELALYDHICVASKVHSQTLKQMLDIPVSAMPQCTDTDRFTFKPDLVGSKNERALFVGNSRGVFRPVVRWAIEEDLEIDIYGGAWDSFIKDRRLKGQSVPNQALSILYGSSRVVLCDHWKDMAKHGFLSNRAYDVVASGGFLATDLVEGIAELLPAGSYSVFSDSKELAEIVRNERSADLEQRRVNAAWVAEHHSFYARAREIMTIITTHSKRYACAE